jgi:hypothetical protein
MADLVPSPLHRALSELYAVVQNGCGTVANALSSADKQMAGGSSDTWTGPAARQWASELSGHSIDLSKQATEFADYVRSELARQPDQVTPDEARTESRMLTGRI